MTAPSSAPALAYALKLLDPAAPGRRLPRAEQSAAAQAVLNLLAPEGAAAASKSHARAMAAAGVAPAGRIGVDVEYCASGRPIGAIAHYLLGRPVADDAAAYRAFTFHEAYFKAFGAAPDADLAHAAAHAPAPLWRPRADLGVLHAAPAPDFVLTLVWTCAGEPAQVSL